MERIIKADDPILFEACAEIFVRRCIAESNIGHLISAVTFGVDSFEIGKAVDGCATLEAHLNNTNLNQ